MMAVSGRNENGATRVDSTPPAKPQVRRGKTPPRVGGLGTARNKSFRFALVSFRGRAQMVHPVSLVTAGIVLVFALFLMLLQTLLTPLPASTRSFQDVPKASVRTGIDVKRITARNPYMRN